MISKVACTDSLQFITTPVSLSKLERVPLREALKHEALDLIPCLAEDENLQTPNHYALANSSL